MSYVFLCNICEEFCYSAAEEPLGGCPNCGEDALITLGDSAEWEITEEQKNQA